MWVLDQSEVERNLSALLGGIASIVGESIFQALIMRSHALEPFVALNLNNVTQFGDLGHRPGQWVGLGGSCDGEGFEG